MPRPLGYRRIVVPISDNAESEKAVDVACRLAAEHGASITLVAVVEVPTLNGTKRLEGTLFLPRHVLRASASAQDIDSALDVLVGRLERQVRDYRAKRKKKLLSGANPLKSTRIGPSGRDEEA